MAYNRGKLKKNGVPRKKPKKRRVPKGKKGEFRGKNKVVVSVKQPTSDDEKASLLLEGVVVESAEDTEPLAAGHADGT